MPARSEGWELYREARHLWVGVDRRRKARVKKAVREGTAVADPRDAALAVAWARMTVRSFEVNPRPQFGWRELALFGGTAVVLGLLQPDSVLAVVAFVGVLAGLCGLAILAYRIIRSRRVTRARAAEAANLGLAETIASA
jgi:hypothetical protein